MSDADHVLLDNRSLVQILRGIVGRRPDDFHAALVGLPVGIRADKRRKERVMNVDHRAADLCEKVGAQNLHVAGHDHQFHAVRFQCCDDLLLLLRLGFFGYRQNHERDFEEMRPFSAGLVIRNDDRDIDVQFVPPVALQEVGQTVILF